jgi:hypothetical protein
MVAFPKQKRTSNKIEVPDYLVREVINGRPWFYRGFRDVLLGLKQPEEVMACSSLQSVIVNYLNTKLWNHLEYEPYWVMSNEVGNNLLNKDKAAYDVAVFDEDVLPPDKINAHYPSVPPKLIIEVDLKVELEKYATDDVLVQEKTQKVLDFGVEKVIWFFTKTQKVMIATSNGAWTINSWNNDIELWKGLSVNIPAYLKKRGINLLD